MARPSKNRPIIWHNGAIQTCIFLGERLMSSTIDPLAGKSALTPLGNEINGESLAQRIAELGEWFHNLDLHGVHTAPYHFLGDFPNIKWQPISKAIPQDLTGASVLDIGCNGGFYSIQMKQRGAGQVLGIDVDDRYLNQARFAAKTDRKSTRLNSSHRTISYAVFCLKKKKTSNKQ